MNPDTAWRLPTNNEYAVFTRKFLFNIVRRLLSHYKHHPINLPPQVKDLLDLVCSLHHLGGRTATHTYIMSAFPSAPRHLAREPPKKLVYVWLHKTGSDKQYVGSTTTGLLSRCKSHIRTATVQGQLHLDRRADSQMVQSEPLEMYTTWRQYGLGNFVCIPVSILRDDATTLQVREEEQRWMDILGTLGPSGYNRKRAVMIQVAGFDPGALPRTYGYFDMERRLRAICTRIIQHGGTQGSHY